MNDIIKIRLPGVDVFAVGDYPIFALTIVLLLYILLRFYDQTGRKP